MGKIRDGYKMTELGEIPVEWKMKKVKELLITNGGYALKSTKFKSKEMKSSYQVIRMGNVQMGCLDLRRNQVFIKGEQLEKKEKEYILNIGDVLISLTGTINKRDYGNIAWVNKNDSFILNQRVACVRPQDSEVVNRFYYYLFQTEMFRKQFFVCGMGGTGNQANVSLNDFKEILILKPTKIEQQKIALILSTIDEKIEITENLIEKTKELKKGLMQRLLTKGIGHDRFKDTEIGRIPEDWEVSRLGEITEFSQGVQIALEEQNLELKENLIRFLRIVDYTQNTREYRYIINPGNRYIVDYNDIVMVRYGATAGFVGKGHKGAIANNMFKIIPNEKELDKKFLYLFLKQEKIYKSLNSATGASAMPAINFGLVSKIKIIIPSLVEQKQIALILSAVDEKIDQYELKKEKLQELKKGFMQKLLTGKIRVV